MNAQPDWLSLSTEYIQQMYGVYQKLLDCTYDVTEAAVKQGVKEDDITNCKVQGYNAFDTDSARNKYFQCLNNAKKLNDFKLATECCNQNIAELKDRAKGIRARVMACISKLIHELQGPSRRLNSYSV
ncbi:uncharacterized protein LOC117175251 [Belonocnema kinseyi]|uniref:uncharacterized protein LOC117175251 n=1 Tax=Belonocnema kinseyi TaxID=2817044 RepID=UPI00143CDC49|nr:uncharacterized protein LOC117175251 [Belonocnema kinseyi]